MARWRLMTPHYLNVPGTEWAYEEIDRETGQQARKVFPVPRHLDPANPRDCTSNGECIVTNKRDKAFPRDWLFSGDPTPDMEPVDDEAQAISDSHAPKWAHPIDSLPTTGEFSASLISVFEKQIQALAKGQPLAQPVSQGVDPEAFAALQKQVQELIGRNAQLENQASDRRRA